MSQKGSQSSGAILQRRRPCACWTAQANVSALRGSRGDDFSGNVFRDFKRSEADADQLKAILAAQIIEKYWTGAS